MVQVLFVLDRFCHGTGSYCGSLTVSFPWMYKNDFASLTKQIGLPKNEVQVSDTSRLFLDALWCHFVHSWLMPFKEVE